MSLNAIEPTLSRGQHCVDGVESPRRRADAATEAHRVDGVGRPKFDFHTTTHHSKSRPTPPSVKRASWLFLSYAQINQ